MRLDGRLGRNPRTAKPPSTFPPHRIFTVTTPTPIDPADFFQQVADVALAANAAGSSSEVRDYSIAGHSIRLNFATPELVESLGAALEHRRVAPPSTTPLRVYLFDSARSGLRLPQRPWPNSAYRARMEVEGYTDGRYRVAVSPVGGSVSLLDLEENLAFYWIDDSAAVPHYETGAPLLAIFHWWFESLGLQLVHAGSVGTPNGAVLLVGKGGSGKSTSALACLGSKLGYLGDDYCLLDPAAPAGVHSIYATGKLHPDNAIYRQALDQAHYNSASVPDEKRVFAFASLMPEALLNEAPLAAFVIPKWTGLEKCTWGRTSAAAALAAAAPSTVLQLPGAGRQTFAKLGSAAKQVPAFTLDTGTDLDSIPAAIQSILEELA